MKNLWGSRGVREERTDHTKLVSRTLAGFGLTWHQKVHFSTFDGKLEGGFMTKYIQIGFWISPEARGFWLNVLRRKSILKIYPQQQTFSRNLDNTLKSSFVDKMTSFFMPFVGPHASLFFALFGPIGAVFLP